MLTKSKLLKLLIVDIDFVCDLLIILELIRFKWFNTKSNIYVWKSSSANVLL